MLLPTLRLLADLDKHGANLNPLALFDVHGRYETADPRPKLVQHLHGLDDYEDGPGFDHLTCSDAHVHDDAGQRRPQRPAAVDELVGVRGAGAAPSARLDLVAAAGDLDVEELALGLDQHFDQAVVQCQDVARRVAKLP